MNFVKLQELITEYKQLDKQQGLAPQERGRRLNHFIAELLQCWDIKSTVNPRGAGEIDVYFEIDGMRFITEAKWEENPASTDPIAKLQKRIRQRLEGTKGLFLSMSGFSEEAKKDLKNGEQLTVVLLSREHFEVMLSGFVPPQELIRGLISKASGYGTGFTPLQSLFEPTPPKELDVNFSSPKEIVDKELVIESTPKFRAEIIASNIPFGQTGVAEFSKNKVLLTLEQGIYMLDYDKHKLDVWFGMPSCSRNTLVTKDGTVLMVRRAGVGCLKDGKFRVAGGGFPGNVCLFRGKGDDVWVFSNGDLDGKPRPQITQLGKSIGDEKRYEIDCPPACGTNAALVSDGRFLVIESSKVAVIEPDISKKVLNLDLTNPRGLIHLPGNRFIIASGGVELSELDLPKGTITQVAKLNLQGSVSELAESVGGGGYLFSHYQKKGGETAGILIRWRY